MNINRQDDYVNYETAKLLKEKGFVNDWCVAYYEIPLTYTTTYHPLIFVDKIECNNINFSDWKCAAPTLQMAMRWLRETHHIDTCVCRELDEYGKCFNGYIAVVYKDDCYKVTIREATKDLTYEEATNKAIKYGLTLI